MKRSNKAEADLSRRRSTKVRKPGLVIPNRASASWCCCGKKSRRLKLTKLRTPVSPSPESNKSKFLMAAKRAVSLEVSTPGAEAELAPRENLWHRRFERGDSRDLGGSQRGLHSEDGLVTNFLVGFTAIEQRSEKMEGVKQILID